MNRVNQNLAEQDEPQQGILTPQTVSGAGRGIGCIGLVIGSGVLILGLGLILTNAITYSGMKSASGTVVKYEKGMSGSGPHVRFDVDGVDHVISGQIEMEGDSRGFKPGDTVDVLYDPDDPDVGVVDLFIEKWFTPMIVTCAGMGFVVIGGLLSWSARW